MKGILDFTKNQDEERLLDFSSSRRRQSLVPRNILESFLFDALDYDASDHYYPEADSQAVLGQGGGVNEDDSTALGPFAAAGDRYTVAGGPFARARAEGGSVWGAFSQALKQNSTALGYRNYVNGIRSIGIGSKNVVGHKDCVVIGDSLQTTADDQIIIGKTGSTVYVGGVDVAAALSGVLTQYEGASTTVTMGNSTKGSWVTALGSTSFDATWMMVTMHVNVPSSNAPLLWDVGTGAATSEVVLFPDFRMNAVLNSTVMPVAIFTLDRISIASGTRIAVRGQANGATPSTTITVHIGG